MPLLRPRRLRAVQENLSDPDTDFNPRSTRQTRSRTGPSSVTVLRSRPNPSEDRRQSLRLRVNMSASKLREGTGARSRRSVNVFQENPIVSGPRTSRTRKRLVEVQTSDEEEAEDPEEDDDEDAPGEEDEDADADGDVDMDEAPPPPAKRNARAAAVSARGKSAKSVEEKEMELEEDEEEEDEEEVEEEEEPLSASDSDASGEPDDQDESAVPDINVDDLDEEDDDDLDDDMDSDAMGGKQTKRQRGNLGNDFLQLPMEPQVKKHLTAEERAMRRAEMARRRKNLSEKRNEEEKMDTINRLLRKQPPKRRGRGAAVEATESTPAEQEGAEPEKADPTMARWVSSNQGCKVGVPEEWLGTPTGRVFGEALANGSNKLVEEL
ncbi:hypothetical protein N7468_007250 [Penicillium chermesinum]|uniref:INO80 complex subunit B-like conserved region domain-containing protein n=1 Tax=Penicillium chermesinum TaxID=63820 RepID=A0A9W9TM00_9EURO|nr:uncharacterized protein N7468_007250 [Penicillium chermesinum]KAJ5226025.1 hypothetical protein N7468_007250 [Penicillium chermesinum]KAJ6160779.1 hypothetical protein N7470_004175 [Penicillium chermesinum]